MSGWANGLAKLAAEAAAAQKSLAGRLWIFAGLLSGYNSPDFAQSGVQSLADEKCENGLVDGSVLLEVLTRRGRNCR